MQIYRYNNWVTLYLYVVTGILCFLTVGTTLVATRAWSWAIAGMMCIGAVAMTRVCLSRATIVADADGIQAFFGESEQGS